MDLTIFVFFVLPLATILLAIVLQKILKSPILVAITFFAIYLIVAFVAFSDTLAEALIAVIIYTIIAYITALIVMIICKCRRRFCGHNENDNALNFASQMFSNQTPLTRTLSSQNILNQRNCSCGGNDNDDDNNGNENNLLRISCRCGNSDESSDLLTVDSTCFANDINNNNSELETVGDTTSLAGNTLGTTNQYGNSATIYGNLGRSNMQRRLYRRY